LEKIPGPNPYLVQIPRISNQLILNEDPGYSFKTQSASNVSKNQQVVYCN